MSPKDSVEERICHSAVSVCGLAFLHPSRTSGPSEGNSETAVALPLSPCARCNTVEVRRVPGAKKPGFLGESEKDMPYDCVCARGG